MEFNLCTIDWTALGSIATFFALFVAYWSIYVSNKQNKKNRELQMTLVRRDTEQKRLDEFVQKIIDIKNTVQSSIVFNLSMAYVTNVFSAEDRRKLEEITATFELNYSILNVLRIKYDNESVTKNLLISLDKLCKDYEVWVINLRSLNLYTHITPLPESLVVEVTKDMEKKLEEMNVEVVHDKEYSGKEVKILWQAKETLQILALKLSSKLDDKKESFNNELYDFVSKEQNRIDAILEG